MARTKGLPSDQESSGAFFPAQLPNRSFLLPGAVHVPGASVQANSPALDDMMEPNDLLADDAPHIVAAEVAPDEEDVATRVAELLENQIKNEVQAQLSKNPSPYVVPAEVIDKSNLCHVPKKTLGFILLVLALVVGGIVFGVTNRRTPTTQMLLSDGATCSSSNQCQNGCCSYSDSDDTQLKCSSSGSCMVLDDASPTTSPITLARGTCGEGNRGNGICTDGTCCSQFGFCGTTSEHCTLPDGTCGDGSIGNGICEVGNCCSNDGRCGSDAEHCASVDGSCGNGNRGNGICADGACCSTSGYCGTTSEQCILPTGTCGDGDRGNGICEKGYCCSPDGWCGTTSEHCIDVT